MFFVKFFCFVIYSLITLVFIHYVNISYFYHYYKESLFCDFKNLSKFDYIIVGAGTAGSVLAAKLSNIGAKILLIEAGGPPIYSFNIPVIAPLLVNTAYDWQYKTVPQKNACLGLINNQSAWPSGKILGGSGRLNNMVYILGHPQDYHPWFTDYKDPTIPKGGSLYVNDQNWYSKLSDAILKGVAEMSYSLKNINKEGYLDFMQAHLTIKNGKRWSTDQLINQSNERLKILTNSLVTKILFRRTKAVGIVFFRNNKMYKAYAKKGLIISAGAVGTPKLLLLSGIGPKKHLDEFKIKTIVDLPVGQHLQDHIITGLDLITIKSNEALSIAKILNPFSLIEYYLFGKGPWTSAGIDVIGTFHSKYQKNKSLAPDLQIMTLPVGLSQDNGIILRKNLKISDEVNYLSNRNFKTILK